MPFSTVGCVRLVGTAAKQASLSPRVRVTQDTTVRQGPPLPLQ